MTDSLKVFVVGGSGFIGSAVCAALTDTGHTAIPVSAPRLAHDVDSTHAATELAVASTEIDGLATALAGADVVINAAGVADAGGADRAAIFGANAVLPRVVREAALHAGAGRFLHVSSAGVQGRLEPLDETETYQPFSPYTTSKAWGEATLTRCPETVIFRPTSVQGRDRAVTRSLVGLARSPIASVAGAGHRPTPQVLVSNVAHAIAFTAVHPDVESRIVLQPAEGLTTRSLLDILGAHRVRSIPTPVARLVVSLLTVVGRMSPRASANARRLQMLWFGQRQVPGWLDEMAWRPPDDHAAWRELAAAVYDD